MKIDNADAALKRIVSNTKAVQDDLNAVTLPDFKDWPEHINRAFVEQIIADGQLILDGIKEG